MTNQLSADGAVFIGHGEGFVGKAYRCPADKLTIGHGFTWASKAFRYWWKQNRKTPFDEAARMTRQEAAEVLQILVRDEYGLAVNQALQNRKVPQHVFDGMVSPVFNLGTGALNWRWAKACINGDYKKAAELLKVTGTTAGGRVLRGLVIRRVEEAQLIEFGDYGYGGGSPAMQNAKAKPLADGMLVRGERGPEVAKLIVALADKGFYDGIKDEIFGPGTEKAVMEYQRATGLKVDGKAGPKTLAALGLSFSTAPATKLNTPSLFELIMQLIAKLRGK